MTLDKSLVVITGAGGRLGRLMVRRFAEKNVRIATIARKPLPPDTRTKAFHADLTDEADTRRVFQDIRTSCGPVNVLVHTVGMWTNSAFLETSLADWESVLRINLTSTFLCFREAARHMSQENGRLIAFSSKQGADAAQARQAAYAASKTGIIRLVEAAGEELASRGITAHAIAPSYILYDDDSQPGVTADDLAKLVLHLAGPAGNNHNDSTLRAYSTPLDIFSL